MARTSSAATKERRAALRVGDVLAGQVYHQIFMEYGRLRLDDPRLSEPGSRSAAAERALPASGGPASRHFQRLGMIFLRSGLSLL